MSAELPIVIVGSGFGGIAMAIRLKRAGIDNFVVLEKASDIGGVWRDNTYPGCACDVPSLYYSFSFEQDYPWSAYHAPYNEIHAYARHCATKYGVSPHIRFGVETLGAQFNEARGIWLLETRSGEIIEARALVSAVGIFGAATVPNIPGVDAFKGISFHSSRWRHDFDLTDKRVAAIGVGASAIQYVPRIAKQVKQLHVVQRTPQYVRQRFDGVPPEQRTWYHRTPLYRRRERRKLWAEFEDGFDIRIQPEKRMEQERSFRAYLEEQVPDPALRAKLMPDYPLGCKRVLASNEFYPALQQANVELVTESIEEITPSGFRTRDGRAREVDAIIYSTGFKPAEYLETLAITGIGGRKLHDVWDGEPEAYLGACVTGFPNFFMLYGPNTNGSGSIIYMLEAQAEFITLCIEEMQRRDADLMQPRVEAQIAFNEMLQERLALTPVAAPGCHTYFKTKSGKIATQWPARMADYDRRARNPVWSDFLFERTKATTRAFLSEMAPAK